MPRSGDGVKNPHDLFSSHGKQREFDSRRLFPPIMLWGSGGAGCNMGDCTRYRHNARLLSRRSHIGQPLWGGRSRQRHLWAFKSRNPNACQ